MTNKKRILITGCAGFIGKHLTRFLLKQGHYVCGVDNFDINERLSDRKEIENLICKYDAFDFYNKDFVDIESIHWVSTNSSLINHITHVVHLAALPRVAYSVLYPTKTNNENVQKTIQFLELCKNTGNFNNDGTGKFIFASSSSVVGDALQFPTPETSFKNPKSFYAAQKSYIEDTLKLFDNLYGFNSISLRFFNVFGSKCKADDTYATAINSWIHKIKTNQPLISHWDGEQRRDLTHVDNVCHMIDLALNAKCNELPSRSEVFNVGCGENISNNEVLEYFKSKFPNMIVEHHPKRPGDVRKTHADISKALALLGYEPKVKFWQGLEQTIKEELGV